jgi:hypothetical protein
MAAQTSTEGIPNFKDHLLKDAYFAGAVHPPKFVTEEQERYRKELSVVSIRQPNFAGHYSVIEIRCGLRCEKIAIVDGIDGAIYPSPFRTTDSEFALPPPTWDFQQPRYISLSNLMIVPNVCPDGPSSCGTFYFIWENKRFKLLKQIKVSAIPIIPEQSPLIGKWEGHWGYTNGVENIAKRFRLTFREQAHRITGRYKGEESRSSKAIRNVIATKADLSTYRMEIDGACWNIAIDGDKLSGMWNGGPCSPIGIGVGARLILLDAIRVIEPKPVR